MAGGPLDVGTISGKIELDDTLSPTLDSIGNKVIQFAENALGKVTAGLGPVGVGLSAVAGVALATGGTLFELASHTAESADEIEAFGLKTGVAIGEIGPLKLAAEAVGGSLGQLATIARQINLKEAADQGGKFSAALADMGIKADDFKKADFQTQLTMLHTGLGVAATKGNALADALAVGGRGMANSIPLLKEMTPELLSTAKSMAMVWTPELIEQGQKFSHDLGLFHGAIGSISDRLGAELLPVMSSLLDDFVKSPGFINGIVSAVDTLSHGLGYLTAGMGAVVQIFSSGWALIKTDVLVVETVIMGLVDGIGRVVLAAETMAAKLHLVSPEEVQAVKNTVGALDTMTSGLKAQTVEAAKGIVTQSAMSKTLYGLSNSLLDVGANTGKAGKASADLAATHEKELALSKEMKAAMEELNSAGTTYRDTVNQIDGATVDAIKYYLEAGVGQKALATAYGLTETQIKAVAEAYKNEKAELKLVADLQLQTFQANAKAHGDDINDWIAGERMKLNATLDALRLEGKLTQETMDAETKAFDDAVARELYSRENQNTQSRAYYQKQYEDAKAAYDLIVATAEDHVPGEVRASYQVMVEKERQLDHWAQYAREANDKVASASVASTSSIASSVSGAVGGVAAAVQVLDQAWITDADIAAATMNKTTVMVRTLSGEVISLADAQKRQQAGGSTTYDLSTKEGMDFFMKQNPMAGFAVGFDPTKAAQGGMTIQQMIQQGLLDLYAGWNGPRFAEGGGGDFGAGTLAMLHGKEIITPVDKVGGGAGGSIVNHFYVNGTGADVARTASAEIMRQLKSVRKFGSA